MKFVCNRQLFRRSTTYYIRFFPQATYIMKGPHKHVRVVWPHARHYCLTYSFQRQQQQPLFSGGLRVMRSQQRNRWGSILVCATLLSWASRLCCSGTNFTPLLCVFTQVYIPPRRLQCAAHAETPPAAAAEEENTDAQQCNHLRACHVYETQCWSTYNIYAVFGSREPEICSSQKKNIVGCTRACTQGGTLMRALLGDALRQKIELVTSSSNGDCLRIWWIRTILYYWYIYIDTM